MASSLEMLLQEVRACRVCEDRLDPQPSIRADAASRLLIIGQAPGALAHRTGITWNDPSGNRLRQWLNLERDVFYDVTRVAIMAMALCFPGYGKHGGDLLPPTECAPRWHQRVRQLLPNIKLTLLIGVCAHRYYLGPACKKAMTETVTAWREYLPDYMVLPHPSWRNTGWLKNNPWFEAEMIPELRNRICLVLD